MKQIKRKNGFTLIELLAVIIILGIIALIVVPTVKDVMDESKKKAFMNTAYGIVEAGELYHTKKDMLDEELVGEVFEFPNGADKLKVKGKLPKEGSMIIDEDGNIAMAISDGKYCITKNFGSDDVTITEDDGNCKLPGYKAGDIVYYNPNEDEICTETDYNNNADKNGNSGCMRWYVYALNGSNPKLILDHNTTNEVAWKEDIPVIPQSSQSEQKYVPNTLINKTNDNNKKTILKNMVNSIEPTALMAKLGEDTEEWHENAKSKVDIITLEEVMNLVPYYQNLSPSEKQLFLNPTEENTSVIDGYFVYVTTFFEEVCSKSENVAICESGDLNAQVKLYTSQPNSPLLPAYMFMDMMVACPILIDCPTYGYWTKTAHPLSSDLAWVVTSDGRADHSGIDIDHGYGGLRPVITLSK